MNFSYSPPLIHEVQRGNQNCKWKIVGAGLDADCIYRSVIPTWPLADPTGNIPGSHGDNYRIVPWGQRCALNDRSKKWCWKSPLHAPNVIKIKINQKKVPHFCLFNGKGGDNYIFDLWIIIVGFFFNFNQKILPTVAHSLQACNNAAQQWENEQTLQTSLQKKEQTWSSTICNKYLLLAQNQTRGFFRHASLLRSV